MIFVASCAGSGSPPSTFGDLNGEILDRMDAAYEEVSQGIATRLGFGCLPNQVRTLRLGTRPSRGQGSQFEALPSVAEDDLQSHPTTRSKEARSRYVATGSS